MDAPHGPYHRRGEPGGPGCGAALDIAIKGADGTSLPAVLLSADEPAPEVELLRTVVHLLGVQWGHDELGWWAAVPMSAKFRIPE